MFLELDELCLLLQVFSEISLTFSFREIVMNSS